MKAKRWGQASKKAIGCTAMAVLLILLGSAEAMAWNPLDYFRDGFKWANDAVAKFAENTYANAVNSARNTVNAVARGDFDGAASELILLSVGPSALGPFHDTLVDQVKAVAPPQIRKYVDGANQVVHQIDDGGRNAKAQVYKNLYNTYKNDGNALWDRVRSGNLDFSEYYKYSFYYAVATADWSNPDAAVKSAEQIGRNQWAAYSWYSSHTWKGATIGYARGEVGLTDQAIEAGAKAILLELKNNPDLGAVGVLSATSFMKAAKEAQCRANKDYCTRPDQRICGKPSEQQTMSLHNKTGQPILVKVHVVSTQTHCQNHACDMSGVLQPGENKSCVVFGKNQDDTVQVYVQAWDPRGSNPGFQPHPLQNEFPPILPEDGYPAFQATFNKAAGNSIDIRYGYKGTLGMDCGNQHIEGSDPQDRAKLPYTWGGNPPANAVRDDRGQLICSPRDRDGVGRAFRGNDGRWYCQFGNNGQEHTYSSNFDYLQVDPGAVQWKGGADPNAIKSPQGFLVCRTNPGGGWRFMEFGWVYAYGCVIGWGGRSPSFQSFEILAPKAR